MEKIFLILKNSIEPFQEILLILFGALLSILGGLVNHRFQYAIERKKDDRNLLFEVFKVLLDLEPKLDDFQPAPSPDIQRAKFELLLHAGKIRTRSYRGLAIKIIEFASKDQKKTKDKLDDIKTEIIEKCSKPLFKYDKKEDELWRRFRKEILKMMKRDKKTEQ